MKLLTDDEIDREAWAQLVTSSPTATGFQTGEMYDIFASVSYFHAFAIAVESEGRLRCLATGAVYRDGGPLMRYFSRRAIIYGGPLIAPEATDREIALLLEGLKRRLRGRAIYVETRNFVDLSAYRTTMEAAGFRHEEHLDYIVETPSVEQVRRGIQRRKREQIRTAELRGVEIDSRPTDRMISAFYPTFRRLHIRRAHTPVPPVEFFLSLNHSPRGRIILIRHNGDTIAMSALVVLEGKTVYHLYVAGLDAEHKNLFPSIMAHYSVLAFAAAEGYQQADLCGAGRPEDNYGVREFKSKFGGRIEARGRNRLVLNPLLYRIGAAAVAIMKKF